MNFLVILTMFAAPTEVAPGAPMTMQPIGTIEFRNTTEKNTAADCARVAKALVASRIQAFCALPESIEVTLEDDTAPVAE